MVRAVAADLDAQRSDLAQAGEIGIDSGLAFPPFLWTLWQQRMAARVVQPHVNAGRTGHAVAGHAEVVQCADHRLFDAVDVFLDEVTGALQIDQRVGHYLARAVVSHLTTAVGFHHRDVARREQVVVAARDALGEHGRVLADPELVGRIGGARLGERHHGVAGGCVVHPAEVANLHAHRTILTIGCVVSVRYSSSSCSRLVTYTDSVRPM
ncbi:hypothetical protein D9M69_537540 [compost metagenome]